jgi:hypothetical protein
MIQQFLTWMRNKTALVMALALTTSLLVGCGESPVQSLTPVGPSGISGATQLEDGMHFSTADSSGGVIRTNGHEDDEDSDVDSDADSDADSEDNQGREAEIEGVIHTVASCQSFTVQVGVTNVPVQTTALATTFRNGGCADVAVGRRVEVRGPRLTLNGPIAATRVEFKETGHETEIEGVIHSVASCQSFTVQVGITNVPVQTNALTTTFRNGGCADVAVGRRVEVKGRRLTLTGPIEATRVEFTLAAQEAEIEGVIHTASECSGSFTVQVGLTTVTVQTSALTIFRNGRCNDLQTGRRVEVKGRRLTLNGPIEAMRVEFKHRGTAVDDEDSDADSDSDD